MKNPKVIITTQSLREAELSIISEKFQIFGIISAVINTTKVQELCHEDAKNPEYKGSSIIDELNCILVERAIEIGGRAIEIGPIILTDVRYIYFDKLDQYIAHATVYIQIWC